MTTSNKYLMYAKIKRASAFKLLFREVIEIRTKYVPVKMTTIYVKIV